MMEKIETMDRRRFVKTFVLGTAFSTVMGRSWYGSIFSELQAQVPAQNGFLRIKVGDYPALSNLNGSVRISVNPLRRLNPTDVKPDGDFYPILVNRIALSGDAQFVTLSTKCTHAECAVPPYDPALLSILCPCHFSTYDIQGRVTGGPALATGDLSQFAHEYDGTDWLKIEVPGLGYQVDGALAESGSAPAHRFRLEFPTFTNVRYEVRYQEHFEGASVVQSFSSTLEGALDKAELTGDGNRATVFVERAFSTGFYQVAMKLLEIP